MDDEIIRAIRVIRLIRVPVSLTFYYLPPLLLFNLLTIIQVIVHLLN